MTKLFVISLAPVRQDLLNTLTVQEKKLLAKHWSYFQTLSSLQKVQIKQTMNDCFVKRVYIKAGDRADIEFMVLIDPAIQSGLLVHEIKRLKRAY